MAWLTDTLLTLPTNLPAGIDLTNANNFSLPDLLNHLHDDNIISLHLLLSSPTRGFLTAICRRLTHLDYAARKAIIHTGASNTPNSQNPNQKDQQSASTSSLSPALRAAYVQIATLTSSSILRIKTIENLLLSLTSLVKTAYSTSQPPLSGSQTAEKARNALEIRMLFGGQFPDAFKTVIVELFRKEGLLDGVRGEIEPAKLFFADFGMLEVDEDPDSMAKRKRAGVTMDCFRKAWLVNPKKPLKALGSLEEKEIGASGQEPAGGVNGADGRAMARWRRCARCAAVMEDVLIQRQVLQWLVMQQRRCFCGGYWNTLVTGELSA